MYKKVAEDLYKELCPGCEPTVPQEMYALIKMHYIKWELIPPEDKKRTFDFYVRLMLTQSPLSKENAMLCFSWGHKITHKEFDSHEYIEKCHDNSAVFVDEKGDRFNFKHFWSLRNGTKWDIDWALFKLKDKKNKI